MHLTNHAELRLSERNIELDEVKSILLNPELKYYDVENRHLIAIGKRNRKEGHYLIVVYDYTDGKIEVITIIDTSKSLTKIVDNRIKNGRWIEL